MPSRRDFLIGTANVIGACALSDASQAAAPDGDAAMRAEQFIRSHEEKVRPLERAAALAWWNANISGKDEDFAAKEETQNRLDAALADGERFAELKALKGSSLDDPIRARQIDVLYLTYLEKQVDPRSCRRSPPGRTPSRRRSTSPAPGRRQGNDRQRGPPGPQGIRRPGAAEGRLAGEQGGRTRRRDGPEGAGPAPQPGGTLLGFNDFHAMQLSLNEQSQEHVLKLFDELDDLTREPFLASSGRSTPGWPGRYGIRAEDMNPWHYHDPFFQEPPAVYEATSTRRTPARTSSSSAAASTAGSACRSTT